MRQGISSILSLQLSATRSSSKRSMHCSMPCFNPSVFSNWVLCNGVLVGLAKNDFNRSSQGRFTRGEIESEGFAVVAWCVRPNDGFQPDARVAAENQAGSSVAKGSEFLRRHQASIASTLQSGCQWQHQIGGNRLKSGWNLGGHGMRGTVPKPPAHGVADDFRCVSLHPMATARYGDQSVVLIDPIPRVA